MITRTTCTLALSLALPLAAIAKEAPAIEAVYDPSGVQWHTSAAFASAELIVSGPGGFYWTRSFDKGESLVLDYATLTQSYLPNGYYSYEMVLSPRMNAADKKLADEARALGEDVDVFAAPKAGYVFGGFTVSDGIVVNRELAESTLKDQVILDDLIVDGSACIGQDCVNGESFGFDTIRLKENNLRIKFQDTSSTASFPTQDWQITINDSSNGGANKFSIDAISPVSNTPFTIEAGAPSHSLYVDDGGRLGVGTSTPVADFHAKSGNTPTLRLEQDGSSGFAAQTWDLAGNEANLFIRDATNGSRLPFRIRPSAPTDSIDIKDNGNVEFGADTAAKEIKVDSLDGAGNYGQLTFRRGNTDEWGFGNTDANFYVFNYESTHNHDALIINRATGNVTITHDLVVSGQCSEVDGPCAPDYVFEPGYELLSLGDLQNFVQENRHLPNVPSASEIHENGINTREFNFAMLEKIEELVLYTLEQQETINALNTRLSELEARTSE